MVLFEEMGQMHPETIDPDDPFPGLARRLTDNVMWGSSSRRARLDLALAKQLGSMGWCTSTTGAAATASARCRCCAPPS